jgi:hypothetical protein
LRALRWGVAGRRVTVRDRLDPRDLLTNLLTEELRSCNLCSRREEQYDRSRRRQGE